MSFSFGKLATVPSVCQLWHTMLLSERKVCKAQLQKYMHSKLPRVIPVQMDMLAEPWHALYVRNRNEMVRANSGLLDFISAMLSGGTMQTKEDLRPFGGVAMGPQQREPSISLQVPLIEQHKRDANKPTFHCFVFSIYTKEMQCSPMGSFLCRMCLYSIINFV